MYPSGWVTVLKERGDHDGDGDRDGRAACCCLFALRGCLLAQDWFFFFLVELPKKALRACACATVHLTILYRAGVPLSANLVEVFG